MAFGIQSILTNTDGSAGRDKSDVRPVPDLATHVNAAEWNNVKRAVVELMGALGRSSGEDADSLVAALLGSTYGPRTSGWRIAEDFLVERAGATVVTTGAGASAIYAAAESPGDGAGHLLLQHGAVAGSVLWHPEAADMISADANPVCRVRFKTPSNMTLSDGRIGISDIAGSSYALIGWDHTTGLRLFIKSSNGGASGSTDLFTATVSTWYELEIRVTSGTIAGVYDASGALVKTLNTANAVPTSGDLMQPFVASLVRVGAGSSFFIDWMVGSGARL